VQAAPPPAKSEPGGIARPITQAQLKVAHYATADGMTGLVLDRTGAKPRVRFDGEKDVLEVKLEADRAADYSLTGWRFLHPNGGRLPLYLRSDGSLEWTSPGGQVFPLNSDAPADPLPPR
jgi:hypothetical protein